MRAGLTALLIGCSRTVTTTSLAFSQSGEQFGALGRRRRFVVMLKQTLICLLFSSMANADSELLEVRLQAILDEAVEAGLPAVSASLVRGEQSWAGVAGETSSSSGEPLNVNSRFRIASITKLFTATVILQLVDEGKLHLSDTLTEMLPERPASDIPHADTISLSMLLDHTSGIRNFTDDSAFWQEAYERRGLDRTWEPGELIGYSSRKEPYFKPGEAARRHYSSTNYILLGSIIERTTGRPLAEIYRARIFRPLGMTDTFLEGFEPGLDSVQHSLLKAGFGQRLLAKRRGWEKDARKGVFDLSRSYQLYNSWAWAAGGLSSSAADLQRFLLGLVSNQLLSPESQELLIRNNSGESDFGKVFGGSGGWDGITASAYEINSDVRIVVLANGTGFKVNADDLRNLIFEAFIDLK